MENQKELSELFDLALASLNDAYKSVRMSIARTELLVLEDEFAIDTLREIESGISIAMGELKRQREEVLK